MKGVVFTELFEMVSALFGEDMVDDILDDCDLASGGSYTTVGTYDHRELIEIVGALSKRTGIPFKDLVQKYGHHLFFRFNALMPNLFDKPKDVFGFLESLHEYIHVEVKKIYPDASLPHFETTRNADHVLTMVYRSRCPFADFAEGLMGGCIAFYNENITIKSEDRNNDQEYSRIFTLTKY